MIVSDRGYSRSLFFLFNDLEEESSEIMARLRMPVELVNMVIEVQSQKKKELELHLCLEGCKRLHECGLLVDTEAQMTEKEKRKMRNEVIYLISRSIF